MLTLAEVQAVLDRLDFRRSHTKACQSKNNVKRWGGLDGRKRCACPYYSCGVHDVSEGFRRKSTDEITEEKARAVVKQRLETANPKATLPTSGTPIATATADFMHTVKSKEHTDRTYVKYRTLMDQLEAFCKHKGYTTIQSFDQDAMLQFWNDLGVETVEWKNGTKWTKNSLPTRKRLLKTMRLFFARCMRRGWITADPSEVVEITPEPRKKKKHQVKFLNREQMAKILDTLDSEYPGMTPYNKIRLKALILLMRWCGLRISDAVVLKVENIKGDVLLKETKKTKTPVQLPIPSELKSLLDQMTPYEGGFYFWDRRSENSNVATVEGNFGNLISKLFSKASIKENIRQVSHRFRNTFAVHLLSKGVPLETVSLMLSHKNISTTEDYYADFAKGYMDRAEQMVRKVWDLKDGETL
jgi:site-specific recombinase XerD